MSKLIIEINDENEAFDQEPGEELGRVLRNLATEFREYGEWRFNGTLLDHNGANCGTVRWEE